MAGEEYAYREDGKWVGDWWLSEIGVGDVLVVRWGEGEWPEAILPLGCRSRVLVAKVLEHPVALCETRYEAVVRLFCNSARDIRAPLKEVVKEGETVKLAFENRDVVLVLNAADLGNRKILVFEEDEVSDIVAFLIKHYDGAVNANEVLNDGAERVALTVVEGEGTEAEAEAEANARAMAEAEAIDEEVDGVLLAAMAARRSCRPVKKPDCFTP